MLQKIKKKSKKEKGRSNPSLFSTMEIGSIHLQGQVILGPMAGITNAAYRSFCKEFGCALTYTEMVSDCGLIYQNEETYKYLRIEENDHPVALQLFGGKKTTLLQALEIVKKKKVPCDIIDINMGCPVPKVTKTGAGSSWLRRTSEMKEMMTEFVENSPVPVTVKIRLGWDASQINFKENVKALEEAGVKMICIHARTRAQLYQGKANYELLRGLREQMQIPLVISGDIFSLEDAIQALEMTHADGVMVARGALGNPQLIRQIDHYLKTGEKLPNTPLQEQMQYLLDFADRLIALKGEEVAIRELRGIGPHFLKGYPNLRKYKIRMTSELKTRQDLKEIVEEIERNLPNL